MNNSSSPVLEDQGKNNIKELLFKKKIWEENKKNPVGPTIHQPKDQGRRQIEQIE